jgi:hypothetical protein
MARRAPVAYIRCSASGSSSGVLASASSSSQCIGILPCSGSSSPPAASWAPSHDRCVGLLQRRISLSLLPPRSDDGGSAELTRVAVAAVVGLLPPPPTVEAWIEAECDQAQIEHWSIFFFFLFQEMAHSIVQSSLTKVTYFSSTPMQTT